MDAMTSVRAIAQVLISKGICTEEEIQVEYRAIVKKERDIAMGRYQANAEAAKSDLRNKL